LTATTVSANEMQTREPSRCDDEIPADGLRARVPGSEGGDRLRRGGAPSGSAASVDVELALRRLERGDDRVHIAGIESRHPAVVGPAPVGKCEIGGSTLSQDPTQLSDRPDSLR